MFIHLWIIICFTRLDTFIRLIYIYKWKVNLSVHWYLHVLVGHPKLHQGKLWIPIWDHRWCWPTTGCQVWHVGPRWAQQSWPSTDRSCCKHKTYIVVYLFNFFFFFCLLIMPWFHISWENYTYSRAWINERPVLGHGLWCPFDLNKVLLIWFYLNLLFACFS